MIRKASELLSDDPYEGKVLLYGRWWSKEDAAYAAEIQADMSLRASDMERLWRTNRPSVRAEQTEGVKAAPAAEPQNVKPSPPGPAESVKCKPSEAVPALHIRDWFTASGLTKVAAAEQLETSRPTLDRWLEHGAPDHVMQKLAALSKAAG